MATVKWNWWYPDGCIKADGYETHETDLVLSADVGADVAQEIVDDFIENNFFEGGTFEVELLEPASVAGVYDVEIEWTPYSVATKREGATVVA